MKSYTMLTNVKSQYHYNCNFPWSDLHTYHNHNLTLDFKIEIGKEIVKCILYEDEKLTKFWKNISWWKLLISDISDYYKATAI